MKVGQITIDKKIFRCFGVCFGISVILIVFSVLSSYNEDIIISNERVTPFNDGWKYSVNGISHGDDTISLPNAIPATEHDVVVITNTLPEKFTKGMTISFRSSHQFVKVFVDGERVYQFGYDAKRPFGKSPGAIWNFVRLDEKNAGKEIAIELISPYSKSFVKISGINYGSKNANAFSIINGYTISLFISALIIVIGVVLVISCLFFRKYETNTAVFYLGLFTLFSGVWSLIESRMTQFLWNNQFALTIAALTFFMLLPIPLILFILETHSIHNKKPIYVMCFVLFGNFIILTVLQIFDIIDFYEALLLTHSIFAVAIGVFIYTIFIEAVHYKNKKMYVLGFASCTFILVSCIDFIDFYVGARRDVPFFFRFALLVYVIVMAIYAVKQMLKLMTDNMRIEVLEKLAYIDILTDLQNRTSFEKHMEEYRSNKNGVDNLMIGVFDINNLKLVNDTVGHSIGDELINLLAKCLTEAFNKNCDIFRIGGDEFTVLINDVSQNDVSIMVKHFDELVEGSKTSADNQLKVAYGVVKFDHDIDKDADELFKRADSIMYEQKARMKGHIGRRRTDR